MFTQCSNCQTVFRLSAELLRAAGGQVRCGRCGEVFNALQRLSEDPATFEAEDNSIDLEARADTILESVVMEQVRSAAPEEEDNDSNVEIAHLEVLDFTDDDDDKAIVASLREELPEDVEPEEDFGDTSMEFTLPPGELDRIFIESKRGVKPPFPLGLDAEPVSPNPFVPPQPVLKLVPTEKSAPPPSHATVPLPVSPPAAVATELAADDEEDLESSGIEVLSDHRGTGIAGLVAENVRRQVMDSQAPEYDLKAPPPRPASYTWWLVAAIAGALLLLGQIVHQHRQYLADHTPFGGLLRLVYSSLGAPMAAPADLAAYQLRQWGVTGEPGAGATLKVRASILNTSTQLVSFPLLRVTLANRYGARIGARDFEPNEYLGKPMARLLAPGERVDATLSIVDPGKDAEGFEIDVCVRGSDRKIVCANDVAAPQPKT